MNFKQLEHFYHAGKWGGVAEAARNAGFGVTEAAVNIQLAALEKFVGVRLFERNPFALTPAGQDLFEFAESCFGNSDAVVNSIRAKANLHLSIGAPEIALCEYLKRPIKDVRKQFPQLDPVMHQGDEQSLLEMLRLQKINIAATILNGIPAGSVDLQNDGDDGNTPSASASLKKKKSGSKPRVSILKLLDLPLVLLVPEKNKMKSAEELWKNKRVEGTILLLPPKHSITRHFRDGLNERGITRFKVSERPTIALLETYVREGNGPGVSVAMPGAKRPEGIRVLPLKGFAPISFGLVWQGEPNATMKAFIEAVKVHVRKTTR